MQFVLYVECCMHIPSPSQHAHIGPVWDRGGLPMWAPGGNVSGLDIDPKWVAHVGTRSALPGPQVGPISANAYGTQLGPTWASPYRECGPQVGMSAGSTLV